MSEYKIVVCGGTFDLFHKGHREFLKFVVSNGQKAVIGITTDEYVKQNKSSGEIQTYEAREKAVLDFLNSFSDTTHFEIQPINDLYGPTLSNDQIDALIVTEETKKGADIINRARKEKGLSELPVVIAPFVKAEDGQEISSSRIRSGEINREGRLYIQPEWFSKTFLLPEDKRHMFQEPFGEVIEDFKSWIQNQELNPTKVISVGDETAKTLNEIHFEQKFSIIDFKINRQERFSRVEELGFSGFEKTYGVSNPAGSVTGKLIQAVYTMFSTQEKQVIQVNGEEDLAVLPVILRAPLEFVVFYGQPGRGIVKVEVTEDTKEKAYTLFLVLTPQS